MSETIKKCFCDLYIACVENPNKQVSVGYDAVNKQNMYKTGTEFVKLADLICPGTSVFIGSAALSAENINIEEASVTFPRDAVDLQCEYFVQGEMGK